MKRSLFILSTLILGSLFAMGEAPAPTKSFQAGVTGLGFRWDSCREGDVVRYVVFAYGARPRKMGDEKPGQWVSVAGASSRNPKVTLRLRAKEQRDLLTSPDLIYQIDREGNVSTYDERVTTAELTAFMASGPREYTAAALLRYVQDHRAARP